LAKEEGRFWQMISGMKIALVADEKNSIAC
jgi:hypothetical protein